MTALLNPRDVDIVTRDYVVNHGKAPRGRGGWAFCKVNPNRADYLNHLIWVYDSTYRDACSVARSVAASQGVSVLYVCS